jgi:hypothetical protein
MALLGTGGIADWTEFVELVIFSRTQFNPLIG